MVTLVRLELRRMLLRTHRTRVRGTAGTAGTASSGLFQEMNATFGIWSCGLANLATLRPFRGLTLANSEHLLGRGVDPSTGPARAQVKIRKADLLLCLRGPGEVGVSGRATGTTREQSATSQAYLTDGEAFQGATDLPGVRSERLPRGRRPSGCRQKVPASRPG